MTHLYRLPSGELVNLDPDKIINAYHQKENEEYHEAFDIVYHEREEICSFREAADIEILKKWTATFPLLSHKPLPSLRPPILEPGRAIRIDDPAWLKKSDTP